MTETRLIERWLPIAEIGAESLRERTPMTPFPAPNRLHVWWARRPLVASRAVILASLLPSDVDRAAFLHAIGIHGDPLAARATLDEARRTGVRVDDPYGYERAFRFSLGEAGAEWLAEHVGDMGGIVCLDPTAGGGNIPFEATRLGLSVAANDLNPVAGLVMAATVQWPLMHGSAGVATVFAELAERHRGGIEQRLTGCFPQSACSDRVDITYLYARTIVCPYCGGVVPLSPNWRLAPGGKGVRLVPQLGGGPGSQGRVCGFEIVERAEEQSEGTVARGDGLCPYSDCERQIGGDHIKAEAQAGRMGDQLYAVVFKERVIVETKTGRKREKWVRGYRAPRAEDDNGAEIWVRLEGKLPEWEALDMMPGERIPEGNKTMEPKRYGMAAWRDLFSARQLLCHGTSVEVFREMLEADRVAGELTAVRKAAYGYLALALDKLLNYNSRMSVWMPTREVVANTFNRHDFAFCWSHAEMAPLVTGLGYDWAFTQTAKCIKELVELLNPKGKRGDIFDQAPDKPEPPPVTITCKSADSLDHIQNASIDAVVMDPPYYDNVMYAELSDFFGCATDRRSVVAHQVHSQAASAATRSFQ